MLKCIYFEWRWLFGPFRYMLIQTVQFLSKLLASLMRNHFPKRPSGAPLHIFFKIIRCSRWFCNPVPNLRLCIALFAVAEGLLLTDIGWCVLFSYLNLSKLDGSWKLNSKGHPSCVCLILLEKLFLVALKILTNHLREFSLLAYVTSDFKIWPKRRVVYVVLCRVVPRKSRITDQLR